MTLENDIERSFQLQLAEEIKNLPLPPQPTKSVSFSGIIIVGGLPSVPHEKIEKFKSFLLKNLQASDGKVLSMVLPVDKDGQSKGICFIQFNSSELAKETMRLYNGRAIDKMHTFQIMMLEDYEKILLVKDEFQEPPRSEFKFKNDMMSWLLQEQCQDQILFNFKNAVINIYEHSNTGLKEVISRERFTESQATWSPCGTYLASMHDKGVALWGGKNFEQIMKFNHWKVQHLSFSPKENYLITYSFVGDASQVTVWNIIEEVDLRKFVIPNEVTGSRVLPQFRWSFDDKYFARKQSDKISVYESCSGSLLDKKSIEIAGVRDLMWSSNSHFISFWLPETINAPAKVMLMEIPSKEEIFTKNLFNVADINLHWSYQDEFLGVVGDRYTKKKVVDDVPKYVGLNANLEIFRVKEKEIPVDKIDIKEKRQVVDFQWEPCGSRFGIITSSVTVTTLQIYDTKVAGQIQEIRAIEWPNTIRMTMIRWSPKGQHMVVAALRIGSMEFIDGSDGTVFHKCEHPNLYDLSWDPTGRYIVSYTLSLMNESAECIVNFWNITGKKLHSRDFPGLKQIVWRPRPPCLLPEKTIKEIKKGMSKFITKFMHEDEIMTNETKRQQIESRRLLMGAWRETRRNLQEKFQADKSARVRLRRDLDTDSLECGHEKEKIVVLVSSKTEAAA